MAQVFRPDTNTLSKVSIVGAVFLAAAAGLAWFVFIQSPYVTRVNAARAQPVPFSHKHHVYSVGLDCRYCHTSVETSSFAGIPPTKTCMNCHIQIWANSPALAPVRESFRTDKSIQWVRVHDLPNYVYFNHSIHINKGVGCSTCHGRVDLMPLMWKTQTLYMRWCMDCHRQPERFLRPRDQVFNMEWQPPPNQLELGRQLVQKYHINKEQMLDCNLCHR